MRVFYARAGDNPNYGIADALARLVEPPQRLDLALFRGTRVPLLPLNFPPESGGFADLRLYGLVILAGVDPVAIEPREQLALAGYVERGGALMLVGGSHAFGNAWGSHLLLGPVLPVKVARAPDLVVNAAPRLEPHPLSQGLPEPLGYVSTVHRVEPKERAQVAMRAAKHPLVVTGESGLGRVVVVASFPQCAESEYGWFFTGDAFDDFMRNAVAWLTRSEVGVGIERFALPKRRLHPGDEGFGRVSVAAGSPPGELKLVTRLSRADGTVVGETASPVRPERNRGSLFSFRVPEDPAGAGLHYVALDLLGPEGRVLARRDVGVVVVNPTRVEVDLEFGRRWFWPGGGLRLRLQPTSEVRRPPAELGLEIYMLDGDGKSVAPPRRRTARAERGEFEAVEVELALANLRPGAYQLRVEARLGDELLDVASEEVLAMPLASTERFPLIAGGVWRLDRGAVAAAVDEVVMAGANAALVGGPAVARWGERRHDQAMVAYAQEKALARGLSVARQLAVARWPCPSARGFALAFAEAVRPALEAIAGAGPVLFAHLALPPGLRPWSPCRCSACREASEGRPSGGRPLRERMASSARRFAAALKELRDELAPGLSLAAGLDARCVVPSGRGGVCEDALPWAETFEVLEVGGERELTRLRASLAYLRCLGGASGKRFGAVVETELGYLPPAEAAWTALVHGAQHLRAAGNAPFVGDRREPPLGEAVGKVFSRVSRIGPFLAASERAPSPVGLIAPTETLSAEEGERFLAACEFLHAALGEVDLLDSRLADDEALATRKAIAIMGTSSLPGRVAERVARFVERGGLLLADATELTDETGGPLSWPAGFFGTAQTTVFEDVAVRRRRFGLGRTVAFSSNLLGAFGQAVAQGDAVAAGALAAAAADAAREQGIRPLARAEAGHVELAARDLGDTWLILAVNHGDEPARGCVWLDEERCSPGAVFDAVTGAECELDGDGRSFEIGLAPRDGGAWVVYARRPFGLRVELEEEAPRVGGELRYRVVVASESGEPAVGRHLVRVGFEGPDGAERPGLGGEFLTTDGVAERVARFASNERAGRWRLRCWELTTRRVVRGEFELKDGGEAR